MQQITIKIMEKMLLQRIKLLEIRVVLPNSCSFYQTDSNHLESATYGSKPISSLWQPPPPPKKKNINQHQPTSTNQPTSSNQHQPNINEFTAHVWVQQTTAPFHCTFEASQQSPLELHNQAIRRGESSPGQRVCYGPITDSHGTFPVYLPT